MTIESAMGIGETGTMERELQFYRRECNDLGGRLARVQEEQSKSAREARRSRTVVKLVREAYRLADPTQAARDVGGPILEIIIDNLLCDRAALLREEPFGSQRFLVSHAIGTDDLTEAHFIIRDPPPFFFSTSSGGAHGPVPGGLLDVLGLPNALWAYDASSGHALVVGNHSEGNANRPFEGGDQELIEGALCVYLDILYRKHAEVQLRQAKQEAEAASRVRAEVLGTLAREVQGLLDAITVASDDVTTERHALAGDVVALPRSRAGTVAQMAAQVAPLVENAAQLAELDQEVPAIDVEWVALDDVISGALAPLQAASDCRWLTMSTMPQGRHVLVCADRERLPKAMRCVIADAVARAPYRSQVRVLTSRRSDGALEIGVTIPALVSTALLRDASRIGMAVGRDRLTCERDQDAAVADLRMEEARRVIRAHDGVVTVEARPGGAGTRIRIMLPARCIREDDLWPAAAG